MIEQDTISRHYNSRPLLVHGEAFQSYGDFFRMVEQKTSGAEKGHRLDVDLSWSPDALSMLVSGLINGDNVLLDRCPEDAADLDGFREDFPLLVISAGKCNEKRLHVVHSATTFLEKFRVEDRAPKRCLVLHEAGGIEGLELFLEQLHEGGSLVVPRATDAASVTATLEAEPVDLLSFASSKLQALLSFWELSGTVLPEVGSLRVCGQSVTSGLWSRLQVVFPEASLHQRLGLPELGMLPVSDDPAEPGALYLEAPNHTWKVQDGELHVWCPRRMLGTLDSGRINFPGPWYATGFPAERTPRASIRILATEETALQGS